MPIGTGHEHLQSQHSEGENKEGGKVQGQSILETATVRPCLKKEKKNKRGVFFSFLGYFTCCFLSLGWSNFDFLMLP